MIQTGLDLVGFIEEMALTAGKIFIPDSFDEAIANSVINFASRQAPNWEPILDEVVKDFIKKCGFTLTIKEFGNKVPDTFNKIKTNYEAKKEFDTLVQQTRERMKNSDL